MNMKGIIALVPVFFAAVCIHADAPGPFADAELTYIKGKVFVRRAGVKRWRAVENNGKKYKIADNTFIKSAKNSAFILTFAGGSKVRCGGSARLHIKKNSPSKPVMRLGKGRAWFRINRGQGTAARVETPRALLETGGSVFSCGTGPGVIAVYSGKIKIIKGSRTVVLSRGKKFSSGETSKFMPGKSGWEKWNYNRDKADIVFKLDVSGCDYGEAKRALLKGLEPYYFAGDAVFRKANKAESAGDMAAGLNITDKGGKLSVKGSIRAEDEAPGIIDITEEYKNNEKSRLLAFRRAVSKAAEIIAARAEEYTGKILKNGRRIFVEADGINNIDEKAFFNMMKKPAGAAGPERKEYYGQKIVIKLVYRGVGGDIAEFLDKKILKNNVINVWKYSKNIVKLSFERIKDNKD